MVRFLKIVILVPVAILILIFAFANHHSVMVSLDPFSSDAPAFSFTAPLFAVAIGSVMVGVVAGAFATWLSQGRYRRAARRHRAEADKWRLQAEALKTGRATPQTALPRNS